MKIIETLNDEKRRILIEFIREKYQDRLKKDRHFTQIFRSHIENIINKKYLFKVNIFASDYINIWIASALPEEGNQFQTLSHAVKYIQLKPSFLLGKREQCLNGDQVQKYLNIFNDHSSNMQKLFIEMGECFMQDGDNGLHPSGGNNITDGMHRLVAYGLATNLNEIHFPVPIYFGTETNKV